MSEPDINVTLRQRIGRFALTLVWWLEYDRSRPASLARENYLRRRMGLKPVRSALRDDKGTSPHEAGQ
jgi:hypothetical protein